MEKQINVEIWNKITDQGWNIKKDRCGRTIIVEQRVGHFMYIYKNFNLNVT